MPKEGFGRVNGRKMRCSELFHCGNKEILCSTRIGIPGKILLGRFDYEGKHEKVGGFNAKNAYFWQVQCEKKA